MPLLRALRKLRHRLLRPDPLQRAVARGLVVGDRFVMMSGVILDPSHVWHIAMGDDVTLAPRVHILAHDASTKRRLGYTRIGKVTIGDRVFVGASAIILPGVTIGDDVVIGAGSVVARDVPSGHLAAGNPARVLCTTEEYFQRRREEMEAGPCFGEEYTTTRNVTPAMKREMNERMQDGIGYVV